MSMIIPELTLSKIIIGLLKHIKIDFDANPGNEQLTLLYRYFFGLTDHKKDYYLEAKDLFTRTEDHARFIETRLYFDASRAAIPTIHITMPSDQQGSNSIGLGEYGHPDHVIDEEGFRSMKYERRFDTQYHII